MVEFGRSVYILSQGVKRIKANWFGICLLSGGMLAASGVDGLDSGMDRFNKEVAKCEKVVSQTNPLVYKLKTATAVCVRLDQGVPPETIIAEFNEQAQKDRTSGLTRVIVGGASAVGALAIGFGPFLIPFWRKRS